MEVRQIQYFAEVARRGSFSRAAAAAGVAQPALSQQMKRLETEMGVSLFDRTTRPVRLTEAGRALHARVERILAELELARAEMREFAGLERGRLVVGALPALAALWLPPVLGAFHRLHPGIEIVLREDNTDELARLLSTGELDLALLHEVPGLHGDAHPYPQVVLERLFAEELVVIVPPGHALARRASISLDKLWDEPFILLGSGTGLSHTILTGAAASGFSPVVSAESADVTTLRGLVAAGLGVSIVPRLPAVAPGPPVGIVELHPPLPAHTAAVAWRGSLRSSAAAALVEVIRDHVAEPTPTNRR